MIRTSLLATAAIFAAAAALSACSPREESKDGIQAVTPSEAPMSEAAVSEAPAASDVAVDASATVRPEPQPDLSADDIAATGNTSRGSSASQAEAAASQ